MCGIVGVFSTKPVEPKRVESMMASLTHRGPDGEGHSSDLDGCLHLGHRRLSVIDLRTGEQPLADATERAVITYNGEVYNYTRIRKELEEQGFFFLTQSDTEVVLNAYLAWGPACLGRFRGMFAFAIWDRSKRRLFLARDPVGIKPLHYAMTKDIFLFSSELKGLVSFLGRNLRLNFESLGRFLRLGYVPSPQTIYCECLKLPPGHYMEVYQRAEEIVLRRTRYWNVPFGDPAILDEAECLRRAEATLEESVRYHMVSDVPVGFYLSGGIDSSLISALGARTSSRKIRTFSMGFHEAAYNELPFANEVAQKIGSDHHVEILGRAGIEEAIGTLVGVYDEPFGDSSALPTFFISKAISRWVKVALSGDGGDELWGGYNRYLNTLRYEENLRRVGPRLKRDLACILGRTWPFAWRKETLRFFSHTPIERYVFGMQPFFGEDDLRRLFRPNYQKAIRSDTYLEGALRDTTDGEDLLDTMQRLDMVTYLPEDCLTKVDRASMANSLEVRVPMVDVEVIRLAFQVDRSLRVRRNGADSDRSLKYILRRLAERHISEAIAHRDKKGFSVPLKDWFSDRHVIGLVEKRFHEVDQEHEIFNGPFIHGLIEDHLSRKKRHPNRLWALLVLFEWWAAQRPHV